MGTYAPYGYKKSPDNKHTEDQELNLTFGLCVSVIPLPRSRIFSIGMMLDRVTHGIHILNILIFYLDKRNI